jgi:hypothetical protein
MTEDHARKTANIVLGLAAAGAAYYVLRTTSLRRAAFRLAGVVLTGTIPVWFNSELRRAWMESAGDRMNG